MNAILHAPKGKTLRVYANTTRDNTGGGHFEGTVIPDKQRVQELVK